jgi:hypothetical protein
VEEIEVAVEFDKDTCRWRVLGEAAEIRRSDQRSEILDHLANANTEGLTPAELSDLTGMPRNNAKQLLFKMAKAGEIGRGERRGSYTYTNDNREKGDNRDNRITAAQENDDD